MYNLAADQLARKLKTMASKRANADLGMVPRPVGMFADDMALQAIADRGLDVLVAAVGAWCDAAGMQIAWGKCAALGADRPIVGPNGEEIAVKASTTYLGVPFRVTETERGVDWAAYYDALVPRARRHLRYMKTLAQTWHPGHRLALVRTYLRPVTEYMAGLFFWSSLKGLADDTGRTTKQLAGFSKRGTLPNLLLEDSRYAAQWKALDELAKEWLQFVVASQRAGPSVASMTAIERPTVRYQDLGVLQWNALAQFKENEAPGLPAAMRAMGMTHWAKEKPASPPEWKRKLLLERRRRLQNDMGDCASRIEHEARTQTGLDRVFTLKDAGLCTSLIRWRQGTWGYKRYTLCVCGAPFDLRHFKACQSVQPPPSAFGIERHLKAKKIPEARLKDVLDKWEQQLSAVPNQAADDSQYRASSKRKRSSNISSNMTAPKKRKKAKQPGSRRVTRSLTSALDAEMHIEQQSSTPVAGPPPSFSPPPLEAVTSDEFDTASEASVSDKNEFIDVNSFSDVDDFG